MLNFVCVPSEQRGSASESIGTTRSQVTAKSAKGWSGVREGNIAAERPLAQFPHLHSTANQSRLTWHNNGLTTHHVTSKYHYSLVFMCNGGRYEKEELLFSNVY
jgi:hypothetical protein